jgi:hypothetical protein
MDALPETDPLVVVVQATFAAATAALEALRTARPSPEMDYMARVAKADLASAQAMATIAVQFRPTHQFFNPTNPIQS